MALDIGGINGLSQDLGYNDRINDIRYRNEAAQRTQMLNSARQKMFADDMNYQNSVNAYDNPRIKSYAQDQIKKIGSFVRENPDWETNLDKRIQLNEMKRELKDNPTLHRGIASDMAFKHWN